MERLIVWHRALPPKTEAGEAPGAVAQWSRSFAVRMQAAGGAVLGTVGSAVAVAFDPPDLADALDLCLELLDEAQVTEPPEGGLRISIGCAMGETEEVRAPSGEQTGWGGSALDRAQHLAAHAKPGEVALDARAREAAAALYLFDRSFGSGVLRAETIDRTQPRRASSRRFITRLQRASVAPVTVSQLRTLEDVARERGVHRVVLRGPPGAGTSAWLGRLAEQVEPSFVMRIGGVPGALEPLGSLRCALLDEWETVDAVQRAVGQLGLDERASETLVAITRGRVVARADATRAVRELLGALGADEGRPWVLFDPIASVDPATFTVVVEAARDGGPDVLVLARLPVDVPVPEPLTRAGEVIERTLPALRGRDARAVAQSVLGDDVGSDVAKRVAVLGGDTPLGVEEAARTLVASGDLIHDGERFTWRIGPRSGVRPIPTEALIEERLLSLEEAPYRMLEAACIAPAVSPPGLVERVAVLDGLDEATRASCLEQLRNEAFLRPAPSLRPTSEVLRGYVRQSMPPARSAELHRFMAQALEDAEWARGAFGRATLGYCRAVGGLSREGAEAMLEAGRASAQAGFTRSAVRLAAAAVQLDPSAETRKEASSLSHVVADRNAASPTHSMPAPERESAVPGESVLPALVKQAVEGLMSRDIDAVERCIDIATAEGADLGAAHRLRALAQLARGDHSAAMRSLAQMHGEEAELDPRRRARAALTRALIMMHAQEPDAAVRPALAALAASRGLKDPRGEAAAMHLLSACYRLLGRERQAETIDDASPG